VSPRDQLLALNDELRRLKAGGQRTVTVTAEALALLQSAVAMNDQPEVAPPVTLSTSAAPAPVPLVAPAPVVRRVVAAPAPDTAPLPSEPPVVQLPAGDKAARWAALRELVLNHPVCQAHVRPGKKVVLGTGDLDAKIFFCGEAPGADEEIQGEPFVGAAGQLLTKMIQGMGLKREQVYIGNIMNWRPEMPVGPGGVQIGNRPPTPEELRFCLPFLQAQLEIVQPQLIVALGATAAGGLLGQGTFKTLGEIKGRWHEFSGRPVMVTYHPSYILRNNSNRSKRAIWEDLLQVMERAGLPVSDKQRNFFL
jgi:DNA polymerase